LLLPITISTPTSAFAFSQKETVIVKKTDYVLLDAHNAVQINILPFAHLISVKNKNISEIFCNMQI